MATVTTEELDRLANSLGITTAAFGDLLTALVTVNNANQAAANSTLKAVNAKTIENELLQKRQEREQALITAFQSLSGGVIKTVSGLGAFTSQLYASTNAFDSAKISLDAFGDVFKTVTKIIADAMGVFSFFKGAGNALKTIADSGAELAINALKNRIEQARVITDVFQSVGKSGATFGGNLEILIETSKKSGINLQEFGKFVSTNLQNLVGLGQTVSQSSTAIANLSKRVADTDNALLVLKGSYGELAASTAEYMALQRQIGIVERTDSEQTRNSVRNYIRLQNELAEITGRSAAEQKRAEEQRRQVAAYQMAASKLEGDERNNLMAVMALFDQMGPDMAAAMQEFFANNGQMMNAQNITFATMNKEMFDMGVAMMQTIRQPTEQFKTSMATTAASFVPNIRAQQAQLDQTGMFMLGGSRAGGEVVAMLSRTAGAMTPFLNNIEKLPEIIGKLTAEATPVDRGLTETLRTAIDKQNAMKIELDKIVTDNLKQLPKILDATDKISKKLIEAEGAISRFANAMADGTPNLLDTVTKFRDTLKNAMEELFGLSGSQQTPTTGPRGSAPLTASDILSMTEQQKNERNTLLESRLATLQATLDRERQTANRQNLDPGVVAIFQQNIVDFERRINEIKAEQIRLGRRQEGGIATEPTIVGENNQPEAVIPLARGNIPLNINFEPMLRIMEQQREYLEEILTATTDNSDFLERIYHASS